MSLQGKLWRIVHRDFRNTADRMLIVLRPIKPWLTARVF